MPRPQAATDRPASPALPWRRRWRTALVGAFLLVALVATGQEVFEVAADHKRAEAAAVARHAGTAEALAAATDQAVARYLGVLAATAAAGFDEGLTEDRRRLLLAGIKATQPDLDAIALVEPGGRVLEEVPPQVAGATLAGGQLHRAILDGRTTVVGDYAPGHLGGRPGVPIGAAAREEDGTIRGFAASRLPLDRLARALDVPLSDGARAVLVDRAGRVVVHTRHASLDWAVRDLSGNRAVAEALAGRRATWDGAPSPWSGQPLVGSVQPVGGLGWALAVLQPLDAALAPARGRLRRSLLEMGVTLAVGLAMALVLSGRLARPLAALSEGAVALGRGRLGHRVVVRGAAEIEALAAHFNGMAERLSAAHDELARRETEAETASRRAAFLAEAGTRLASTLDYEATLAATARLAVPQFADYCVVDLLEADGAIGRVAVVHADPAKAALARDLAAYPPDPHGAHPMLEVLRTGAPVLLAEAPDAWTAHASLDPAYVEVLRRIGARSSMIVPLVARGRVLGALTFGVAESGRRYVAADLEFAGEVARRAALAVDNARLYQEAREAVQAREAFLARASHELRTPLTSAIGTVRLARRAFAGRLAEPPDVLLEVADRNLGNMLALINNLLDASKLAAGGDTLVPEPLDLADLARRTVELMAAQARERGVAIDLDVPAGLSLSGDPIKLEQVLVNLLANALAFTPAGGRVTVDAACDRGGLVLRVRDTGEGIHRDDLERVFEPFVQGGGRGRRRGTGLGLAICRQIVSLHGGRIWAESEGPGQGSTFLVRLPAAASGRTRAA